MPDGFERIIVQRVPQIRAVANPYVVQCETEYIVRPALGAGDIIVERRDPPEFNALDGLFPHSAYDHRVSP